MSLLELQTGMPGDLKALYQARADWTRTLSNFRAYRNLWKCSVLNGGVEDEQSADLAQNCWDMLVALRKKIVKMHRERGFSAAENDLFTLPRDEYSEQVTVGEAPPEPARMPDDVRKSLASVLEPDWKEDEHS